MITASALTRLRNCTASAVLPRAENHNVWADAGHEDHERLAQWVLDRDSAAIADIVEANLLARLDDIVPAGARPEVKFAYNIFTHAGRVIGEGSDRDYGTPDALEVVGSCDAFGIEASRIVVIDWKTGFADVDPAATNWQLWFYALAACKALHKDEAIVRIVYTQTGRVDEYVIDDFALSAFASDLERLHVRVAALQEARRRGETMETREGSWCKHCSSKAYCPSKNALLVQVAEHGLAVIGDTALTPERARAGYEQIVRVESLVKEARARLHAYVDEQGAIDLGNGMKFGRDVRPGNERIDGKAAMRAIREVVGEEASEFASEAVEYKASKAGLKRAAKAIGKPKLAAAVEKRIRELGGITRAPESYPYREYPASEEPEVPTVDVDAVNAALESA